MDDLHSPHHSRGDVAVRVVAAVVSIAAGGLWLLCAVTVLSSRFATDAAADPHGYGLIFGTMVGIPAGLFCALTLPFAFPQRSRARAFRFAMPSSAIASVLLVVAFLSA